MLCDDANIAADDVITLEPLQIKHAPLLVEAAHESVAEVNPWMPWCCAAFMVSDAEKWIKCQSFFMTHDTQREKNRRPKNRIRIRSGQT